MPAQKGCPVPVTPEGDALLSRKPVRPFLMDHPEGVAIEPAERLRRRILVTVRCHPALPVPAHDDPHAHHCTLYAWRRRRGMTRPGPWKKRNCRRRYAPGPAMEQMVLQTPTPAAQANAGSRASHVFRAELVSMVCPPVCHFHRCRCGPKPITASNCAGGSPTTTTPFPLGTVGNANERWNRAASHRRQTQCDSFP